MLRHFKDPEIVACGNHCYQIPRDSYFLVKAWQLHLNSWSKPDTFWLPTLALAVKKDAFDNIKGFNEKLLTCEDVDLGYRLNMLGKLVNDSQMEVLHLSNPTNFSSFFFKEYWRGLNSYSLGIKNKNKNKEIIYLFLPAYTLSICLLIVALPIRHFIYFWRIKTDNYITVTLSTVTYHHD